MPVYIILFTLGFFFVSPANPNSIFGDDYKVHIDNRHTELKNLIMSHLPFNWNNWLHLSSLISMAFLICLLTLACCILKIKIWPSLTRSLLPHSTPPHDMPYVINLHNLPQTTARTNAPAHRDDAPDRDE